MITVNLLPDIKKEYIKARRTKRLVISVSTLFSVALIVMVGVGFFYTSIVQQDHLDNLSTDIQEAVSTIKSTEDLDKILTVNEQLTDLPQLHQQKPISSRLFQYLDILTPQKVFLTELTMVTEENRMSVIGRGEEIKDINVFADTLKNASYKINEGSESVLAFTFVEVSSYGTTAAGDEDTGVTFTLEAVYDPEIFSPVNTNLKLSVPKITSTRANVETPTVLFDKQPEPEESGQGEGQ